LKAFVFFKGRSIIYKDQGLIIKISYGQFGMEAMPVLKEENDYVHCSEKKKKVSFEVRLK
jgi:hypothetical protein